MSELSGRTLPSSKEKEELRAKMERLVQLQNQSEALKKEKSRIKETDKVIRKKIAGVVRTEGVNKVALKTGEAVALASIKNHRKPTLSMAHMAIRNVLGPEAEDKVKKEIDALRLKRREQAEAIGSLKIIPIGALRKPREPRKEREQKPKDPTKRRFMRRTTKSKDSQCN